jgi:hypothetical protein
MLAKFIIFILYDETLAIWISVKEKVITVF